MLYRNVGNWLRCVRFQKIEDLIYATAEACNHTISLPSWHNHVRVMSRTILSLGLWRRADLSVNTNVVVNMLSPSSWSMWVNYEYDSSYGHLVRHIHRSRRGYTTGVFLEPAYATVTDSLRSWRWRQGPRKFLCLGWKCTAPQSGRPGHTSCFVVRTSTSYITTHVQVHVDSNAFDLRKNGCRWNLCRRV
jgi:hypothetical protein